MLRDKKGCSLILFPENYTVIDIETTGFSPEYDSIIELAALKIRNNKIEGEFSQLVRDFNGTTINSFISELTGITQEMIDKAPCIENVLKDFLSFVGQDIILGHNVSFDINFIYDNALNLYGCPVCNNYIDIMRFSKKLFKEERHHRLCDISERLDICYEGAHRALIDCNITKSAYDKMKLMIDNTFGEDVFLNLFKKVKKHYDHINPGEIKPDEESAFYEKTCVITGTLERYTRAEAFHAIEMIGGFVGSTITQKTNFLILGNNEYCSSIKDGKSHKQKKAEEYKLKGCDIEIIPETVFYEMLGTDKS